MAEHGGFGHRATAWAGVVPLEWRPGGLNLRDALRELPHRRATAAAYSLALSWRRLSVLRSIPAVGAYGNKNSGWRLQFRR